ncbi:MAG: hypothetical protein ABEJ23_01625 [Haloarculaceae archaeon]
MGFSETWRTLRDRCEEASGATLVTPSSERAFRIEAVEDDRVLVRFPATDEERSLWRDQFEVLADRLAASEAGVPTTDLPDGVEPYVAVLSLAPQYAVEDGALRPATDGGGESPFLRPEWAARTPPERVRDDAVLLADLLDRYGVDPSALAPERAVDLYVLLSDVERGAGRLRTAVGDAVLAHVGPEGRRHGRFGTVTRTHRERRRLKDEATVFAALHEAGVPREWVLGVDPEKLDVVLAVTDLDERDVYDVEEEVYAQKTAVDEAEKQSRLQGLKDRVAALETEDAAALRDDIEDLESRLDAMLAAG